MRHKCLVLPVKKLLKSVHIYGSYRKIKTGVPFFGTPGTTVLNQCVITARFWHAHDKELIGKSYNNPTKLTAHSYISRFVPCDPRLTEMLRYDQTI